MMIRPCAVSEGPGQCWPNSIFTQIPVLDRFYAYVASKVVVGVRIPRLAPGHIVGELADTKGRMLLSTARAPNTRPFDSLRAGTGIRAWRMRLDMECRSGAWMPPRLA